MTKYVIGHVLLRADKKQEIIKNVKTAKDDFSENNT